MGLFDTVYISCPNCGETHSFQSKSGECVLGEYTLENCPDDVIFNINRHSPACCDCGCVFDVDINKREVNILKQHGKEIYNKRY